MPKRYLNTYAANCTLVWLKEKQAHEETFQSICHTSPPPPCITEDKAKCNLDITPILRTLLGSNYRRKAD